VGLPIIDVQVQRPGLREHPAHLPESRLEKAKVVVELVAVRRFGEQRRRVATALEPQAVARGIGARRERPTPLHLARVEGRIEVRELENPVVELG
jgi:hypothetical protein